MLRASTDGILWQTPGYLVRHSVATPGLRTRQHYRDNNKSQKRCLFESATLSVVARKSFGRPWLSGANRGMLSNPRPGQSRTTSEATLGCFEKDLRQTKLSP